MQQQQVPLLSRVVLLHAAVIGVVLACMQITTNLQAMAVQRIQLPATSQVTQVTPSSNKLERVQIPRLTIDVKVVPGRYNAQDKSWELSQDKAHYITGTTTNLTMIYGHNTSTVFELTNSLQAGDTLLITDSNGLVKTYKYRSDHLTVASDTSDLTATYNKPTIALLTCNGFWSQDRRFMFFELTGESQS